MEDLKKRKQQNTNEIIGIEATMKINELKINKCVEIIEQLRQENIYYKKIIKRYKAHNEKIEKGGQKRVEK